jgi:predicted regulator of Ras-like GTPase activity (Roadblock/LC7/MglB family)/predicted Zn-dependent protease
MTIASELDDRIEKCQRILDQDPNSQIFAALAEAYRKRGELERAFSICQSGLKIHPSYGSAHVVMAKINLDRGLYDWAEAEVDKAIELDGSNRAIELLLAEISIYRGEFGKAVRLLKKLSQSDPNNSQIQKLLEIAMRIPEEQTAIMAGKAAGKTAEPEAREPAPRETITEQAPLDAVQLIAETMQLQEIQGSMFINPEGMVVESDWAMPLDSSTCGAAMREISNFLNQELVKSKFGGVGTVLIETEEPIFYVVNVGDGSFVLAGSSRTNLGALRMKMAHLVERYRPN